MELHSPLLESQPFEKFSSEGRYLHNHPYSSLQALEDIKKEVKHERRVSDLEKNDLQDSFQFNYHNNTYYLSSNDAKMNVFKLQKIMKFMIIGDFLSSIFYGITFYPILYILPFIGIGLYGIWKYNYKFVLAFQLYVMSNICLKVFVSTITTNNYQKISYFIFIPYDFYLLYKCWFWIWEMKVLNSYDRKQLMRGWKPNYSPLSVL